MGAQCENFNKEEIQGNTKEKSQSEHNIGLTKSSFEIFVTKWKFNQNCQVNFLSNQISILKYSIEGLTNKLDEAEKKVSKLEGKRSRIHPIRGSTTTKKEWKRVRIASGTSGLSSGAILFITGIPEGEKKERKWKKFHLRK